MSTDLPRGTKQAKGLGLIATVIAVVLGSYNIVGNITKDVKIHIENLDAKVEQMQETHATQLAELATLREKFTRVQVEIENIDDDLADHAARDNQSHQEAREERHEIEDDLDTLADKLHKHPSFTPLDEGGK